MISFGLTKEQDLILKTAKEFAAGELKDIARDCDEEKQVPQKMLDKAWELGLANAAVPEEYGGIGMDRSAMTNVLVCEELAYGCASLATTIMAPASFIQPLIDFGTDEQKKKYLPIYGGEKFEAAAMALHESHFTFDPTDCRTSAEKKGDEWVINGVKRIVPFGQNAKHFLVVAKTGKETGFSGIDAFIIAVDSAGLTISDDSEKLLGLNPLQCSSLTLENVTVPNSERLGGDEGIDGRKLINSVRIANSALCVGLSKAVIDYSIPYAKDRIAFGEPIAKKQAIAFLLAEMHAETESMRCMVWKAASQLDQGVDATKATTLAQHYVNKNAILIADSGVQIFGGHGYIRDLPLEMWLRNARTLTVMEGLVAGLVVRKHARYYDNHEKELLPDEFPEAKDFDHINLMAMDRGEEGSSPTVFGLLMTVYKAWGDTTVRLRRGNAALGNASLAAAGTPEQNEKWGNTMLSMANTEPGCGSDSKAIETTAVLDGDEWVLNGEKIFVTTGIRAEGCVVW
ncbi:MAG: acyl-CoA dehydrogenase family protein, partial [Deltaproteobacteria bacterium]|nr:acyl-CoA dehydrogenase family protein [Deltaproteobacteria bacterium]